MRFSSRRVKGFVGAAALGVTALAGSALAAPILKSGTAYEGVKVVTENVAIANNSVGWTTIASVTVKVGAGHKDLLLARFAAETACYGNAGPCSARVVIRNVQTGAVQELDPVINDGFGFDSSLGQPYDEGDRESHSMDRSVIAGEGYHTLYLQVKTSDSGRKFFIDELSFTVEQVHA